MYISLCFTKFRFNFWLTLYKNMKFRLWNFAKFCFFANFPKFRYRNFIFIYSVNPKMKRNFVESEEINKVPLKNWPWVLSLVKNPGISNLHFLKNSETSGTKKFIFPYFLLMNEPKINFLTEFRLSLHALQSPFKIFEWKTWYSSTRTLQNLAFFGWF